MSTMNRTLRTGALAVLAATVVATPALAEVTLKASAALSTPREQTQAYIKFFLNAINAKGKEALVTAGKLSDSAAKFGLTSGDKLIESKWVTTD